MTLVSMNRRRPTRGFDTGLFDEFNRMFGDLASTSVQRLQSAAAVGALDLYETSDALVLEMAVPGFAADALDISLEGRQLTVRAARPESDEEGEQDRRYWLQGIDRNDVERSVRLPMTVDADAIEARVAHGLLTLRMPKVAESKVRKIDVANS